MTPHSLQKTHRSHRLRGSLAFFAASMAVAVCPSVGLAADPAVKGVAPRPSGHEIGNGGGAWVCRELNGNIRWAGLVDLYEAEAEHGIKLANFKGTRDEILETIHHRIQAISPAWYAELAPHLERVGNLSERVGDEVDADHPPVRPTNERLTRTSDLEVYRLSPDPAKSCALGQIATHPEIVVNYTNESVIHVYQPLKEALTEKGVAALAVHEAVYAWRRSPKFGDVDSMNARRIVGLLFADVRPAGAKQKNDTRPALSWVKAELTRLGLLVPKPEASPPAVVPVAPVQPRRKVAEMLTRGWGGKKYAFKEVIWPQENPLSKVKGRFWQDERGVIWGPRVKGDIAIPAGGRLPTLKDIWWLSHYFGRNPGPQVPELASDLSQMEGQRKGYLRYTNLLPDLFGDPVDNRFFSILISADAYQGGVFREPLLLETYSDMGGNQRGRFSRPLGAAAYYAVFLPNLGALAVINSDEDSIFDGMLFSGNYKKFRAVANYYDREQRTFPGGAPTLTVVPYYVFDAK